MHPCREYAIRNTLDEWKEMIYIYTLYIGNNMTKFDHLSLNIRQNNRYYKEKLQDIFPEILLRTGVSIQSFSQMNCLHVPSILDDIPN